MKTDNFAHPWLHLASKEVLQAIRCAQLYKSSRGLLLSLSIINQDLTLTVYVIVLNVPYNLGLDFRHGN